MENIEVNRDSCCTIFADDARLVHGDRYCYNKAKYDGTVVKIIITCPDHGDFLQTPKSHLMSYGCIKCGRIQAQKTRLKRLIPRSLYRRLTMYMDLCIITLEQIIKIDQQKIEIICPIHGSFFQTPTSHLSGSGCPECKGKICYPSDWLIEKVKSSYGGKYYIIRLMKSLGILRMYDLVIIKCGNHGEVQTDRDKFIEKNEGCPLCE